MQELLPHARKAAAALKRRKETIAVAESSAGGLIVAALLAVPGASAYCRGGAVIYTRQAWLALRDISEDMLAGLTPATEAYALYQARTVRNRFAADWGLSETGASGPTGNRYGNPPGHTCLALAGARDRAVTISTGSADRLANMYAFAAGALKLLAESLD
jgi:nicotinamide-nucleotide amidase